MAQRHCLACRTFLVCLWRSDMQVLTCNTTAAQFVSRRGARSSPSVREEAVQLRRSHLPGVEHLGRSRQQRGLGQQKLSPAEHLSQVTGPRNRSVCHRSDQRVSVVLFQTSLPDQDSPLTPGYSQSYLPFPIAHHTLGSQDNKAELRYDNSSGHQMFPVCGSENIFIGNIIIKKKIWFCVGNSMPSTKTPLT